MPASREKIRARNRQIGMAAGIAMLAAVLIFGGGSYLLTKVLSANKDRPVPQRDTMVLVASSFSSDLEVAGAIQSASVSAIVPEIEGTVVSVDVAEGALVKKGDLLLTLENEAVAESLAEALAGYRTAQADQSQAEDDLEVAEESLGDALEDLAQVQASLEAAREEAQDAPERPFDEAPFQEAVDAAQDAADDAQAALNQAEASFAKAQKDTAKARSALTKAQRERGKLSVSAPQDGTVADVQVVTGQQVSPATGALLTVVDTSKVNCVVQVPESKVGSITKGQSARVSCSALSGEVLRATVLKVSDTPTPGGASAGSAAGGAVMGDASGNGTLYGVTLSFDSEPKGLELGMAVSATISVLDYGTVYYVPATAVGSGRFGMYVEALVDGSTVKQCNVTQVGTAPDGQLVIQGASLIEGMSIRTDISGA